MGRSSCNLLVARALPAEPGRIAGPLYWTSTCHPFLFIRHIAAPTFLRLRISALFVKILAQFRWRIRGASLDLQTLTDDLHLRVAVPSTWARPAANAYRSKIADSPSLPPMHQIGRASCSERV